MGKINSLFFKKLSFLFFAGTVSLHPPLCAEATEPDRNCAQLADEFFYRVSVIGLGAASVGAFFAGKEILKKSFPESFDERYDPLSDLYKTSRSEIVKSKIKQLIAAEGLINVTFNECLEFQPGRFNFKIVAEYSNRSSGPLNLKGRIHMRYEILRTPPASKNDMPVFRIKAKKPPSPDYRTEDPFSMALPAVIESPPIKENVYYEFDYSGDVRPVTR